MTEAAALLVSPVRECAPQQPVGTGEPIADRPAPVPARANKRTSRAPMRRKLLADYLAEARAAREPGQVVTPAWVRQVTHCSRGLSSKIATNLNADPRPADTSTNHTGLPGRAA